MIHRKYIYIDSENAKHEFVYDIIAGKKGNYLTDYIVEAVLRYEKYKNAEEQKKLSRFLGNDHTDYIPEIKITKEETAVEKPKIIKESIDVKEEDVPEVENIEESDYDDSEVNDIDNVEEVDNEISDASLQDMMNVFNM